MDSRESFKWFSLSHDHTEQRRREAKPTKEKAIKDSSSKVERLSRNPKPEDYPQLRERNPLYSYGRSGTHNQRRRSPDEGPGYIPRRRPTKEGPSSSSRKNPSQRSPDKGPGYYPLRRPTEEGPGYSSPPLPPEGLEYYPVYIQPTHPDEGTYGQPGPNLSPSTPTQGPGARSNTSQVSGELKNQQKKGPSFYQPLSTVLHEIRILELGRDLLGHIWGSLETISLTQPENYVALSYRWGNSNDKVPVMIVRHGDEEKLQLDITPNLEKALDHMYRLGLRKVWVDSICINQEDVEERSLQVRNMQLIYSAAQSVIACVGEVEEVEAESVKTILKDLSLKRGHDLSVSQELLSGLTKEDCAKLDGFFCQPYWARVWIIQEVAVARQVMILYGGVEFPWEDVESYLSELSRMVSSDGSEKHAGFLKHFVPRNSHATQVVDLRSKYDDGVPIALFDAIRWTHTSLATESRDRIFALLGLCYDGSRIVPLPNYEQDVVDVLTNMTLEMMKREKTLDMICLGGSKASAEVPSWVPDWLDMWSDRRLKTRLEHRILKGPRPAKYQLKGPVQLRPPGLLQVDGYCIDVIQSMSTVMGHVSPDLSQDEFTSVYTPSPITKGPVDDAVDIIIDAVCLGSDYYFTRGVNNQSILRALLVMLWTFDGRGLVRQIDMLQWLDQNASLKLGSPKTLVEISRTGFTSFVDISREQFIIFVNRLVEVLRSGLKLASTEKGGVGMVPRDAILGDEIWILDGASVPIVLRKSTVLNQYSVIGASYFRGAIQAGPDDKLKNCFPKSPFSSITLQ